MMAMESNISGCKQKLKIIMCLLEVFLVALLWQAQTETRRLRNSADIGGNETFDRKEARPLSFVNRRNYCSTP